MGRELLRRCGAGPKPICLVNAGLRCLQGVVASDPFGDSLGMRQLPARSAAWSVRAFPTFEAANEFSTRCAVGTEPERLIEDAIDPAGHLIGAGSWVVAYQVFV